LDPFEGGPVDERLVAALVLDPVPLHDPDVSAVGEEAGETRHGDRLRGVVAVSPPVAKAPVGHLMSEALDGPLPGGVQLEGGPHQRGPFGVGDDVGHLAVADGLPNVQIAETFWRYSNCLARS